LTVSTVIDDWPEIMSGLLGQIPDEWTQSIQQAGL
jgi:hypothetical protein